MTDLPPGWAWATLEDVLAVERRPITDGPFGSKLATRHYTSFGARVIRLQNIGDGIFRDDKAFISLDYFQELRAHEVRPDDLLLASLGEELPRVCIAPDLGTPTIVKADCIRARIHSLVDVRWVLYALMAPPSRSWATSRIKGVGRPRLGMAGIRQIPIPIPPLAEQLRIVAAIEQFLLRIEVGVHAARLGERKRQLLARRLVDARLEALSSETFPLGSLLREPLANGRSVATDNNGFPVLRLTALRDGKLALSERKGGFWKAAEAAAFLVKKNDFFVSRGNGSLSLVGRGALLEEDPDPVAFPDTMVRIRVDVKKISPEFLRLVWGSRQVRDQIERSARTTAGIYKINQRIIEEIKVPVPKLGVQEQVVGQVSQALDSIGRIGEQVEQAMTRAGHLRRSLLATAFTGNLLAQNPADEPAPVLLDRIRAQRVQRQHRRMRSGRNGIVASKEVSV